MSKAFTKEDVDPPERSGRVRSASGLPPGAANYITPSGAARLRQELAKLREMSGDHAQRIQSGADPRLGYGSRTAKRTRKEITFGAKVTVRDATGQLKAYRILGVDELDLDPRR